MLQVFDQIASSIQTFLHDEEIRSDIPIPLGNISFTLPSFHLHCITAISSWRPKEQLKLIVLPHCKAKFQPYNGDKNHCSWLLFVTQNNISAISWRSYEPSILLTLRHFQSIFQLLDNMVTRHQFYMKRVGKNFPRFSKTKYKTVLHYPQPLVYLYFTMLVFQIKAEKVS